MILVLAGDHVYKMDYREMIKLHQDKRADMTVACITFPKETASNFGVIQVDHDNHVLGFQEKPSEPSTIPSSPNEVFASMGIYLFNRDTLMSELEVDSKNNQSDHDFGKNVIPQMLRNNKRVYVYNFVDDNGKPKYWRDIGTRDAYYQANMDLLGPNPAFNLYDKSWPVRTYHAQSRPMKIVSTASGPGKIVDSVVSSGCIIEGGHVTRSILSSNVKIYNNAEVVNSVIMDGVIIGANAKIQNAILDKEVVVPPNARIGFDADSDRRRFILTSSGIVIVPKRASVAD